MMNTYVLAVMAAMARVSATGVPARAAEEAEARLQPPAPMITDVTVGDTGERFDITKTAFSCVRWLKTGD
jgi:hypothetical protein